MTWWKNGLLLAAGGIAGLVLAAWLEDETGKDNFDYDDDGDYGCSRRKVVPKDGMDLLVEKVRSEAEWAMEECTTDEEREKVYEEVSESIKNLQATLKERGDEIIADLKAQTMEKEDEENISTSEITRFKSSMEDLTKALDETLASLKSEPKPSEA